MKTYLGFTKQLERIYFIAFWKFCRKW